MFMALTSGLLLTMNEHDPCLPLNLFLWIFASLLRRPARVD